MKASYTQVLPSEHISETISCSVTLFPQRQTLGALETTNSLIVLMNIYFVCNLHLSWPHRIDIPLILAIPSPPTLHLKPNLIPPFNNLTKGRRPETLTLLLSMQNVQLAMCFHQFLFLNLSKRHNFLSQLHTPASPQSNV